MKRTVLILILLLAAGNAMAWREIAASRHVRADVFDVGQGDAVLIRTRLGHRILIDGGPDRGILEKLGDVLPPWERSLDAVVLTHPDADHMRGLLAVLDAYRVPLVVWNGYGKGTEAFASWEDRLSAVRGRGTKVMQASAGDVLAWNGRGLLRVLHPTGSADAGSPNNGSLVLLLDGLASRLLLPGDVEREGEMSMLGRGEDVAADILLLAHHGSASSSTDRFLYAVNPRVGIVSAGKNSRYGHPHGKTLARAAAYGITVVRTDKNGDIQVVLPAHNPAVVRTEIR